MTQKVIIQFEKEAQQAYADLEHIVNAELERGVTSSFHHTLLRSLRQKILILTDNHRYGTQIPRAFIPPKYREKYNVSNLWKVDLAGYWRLVYTLKHPPKKPETIDIVEIYLDVLDITDHPTYDKTFGYKKK